MQIYYSINYLRGETLVKGQIVPDTLDYPNNAPACTVKPTLSENLYRFNDTVFTLEFVTK